MLIQNIQDVVVSSMVQLADLWLLAMFVCQVLSVVLVKLRQHNVFDSFDSNHAWGAIMERRCGHEVAGDFIPFGALKVNPLQSITGIVRLLRKMPAPTCMGETEILSSAVVSNHFGTLLLWRTFDVFDTDHMLNSVLVEKQRVQLVHQAIGNWFRQNDLGFLENSSDNLHLHISGVLACMALHECPNIGLELLIRAVRVHQAHPQTLCKWAAHQAWTCWRQLAAHLLLLCGPHSSTQGLFELGTDQGAAIAARRAEFDNVLCQYLLWPGDHVVLHVRHPNVITVQICSSGGLQPESETAHEHVLTASAVAHGDIGAFGQIFASAKYLARTQL